MSQKPAPSRTGPAPTRVSGGIPWWLWLILVVFGVSVAATLVRKAIPVDPQTYVQEGMAAIGTGDIPTIERSIQKLNDFPEHAAEQKLLEGMMYLGKSKPLLAIPFLEEASKDPAVRIRALTQLGNAYMRSRQQVECIAAFESALKEDEKTDEARLNLAYVLKDMICWDEATKHLSTLVERNFRLGIVNQLLGEIYAEMGRYTEAAASYEASLAADPNNPSNSLTVSRLIVCRMEIGNMEGVEEFLPGVDIAGIRESARALILAEKDETDQALAALDQALHEGPNDATANLTYGKVMARIGSKEKAIQALTNLQGPISFHTRNLKLFEIMAKLAIIAEDEELAATAQQKVDQLKDLESQFSAKLADVVKTREGAQTRIELGDLAAATGRFELARSVYQSALFMDSTLEAAVETKIQELYSFQPPFVPQRNRANALETMAPADLAPELIEEPKSKSTPEPEKADTPKADTPKADDANPDDAVVPDKPAKDGSATPNATTEPAPN